MLYDNAQLARIDPWAGIELDEPRFVDVARSTLGYLLGELRHPEGGFFSAEDADSEGVEGKFYVWTTQELERALGPDDAAEAARFFGATPHGNFEGSNILYRPTAEPSTDRIESIKVRMMAHRATRVRPGLDDKVVASWNGLAIKALAEAGATLADPGYLEAARVTARFVLDHMVVDGVLRRSWREGQAGGPGFLEDNAAVALGLFALYAATGGYEWYEAASELTVAIPERFADPEGGFFDTSDDGESLIKRPRAWRTTPCPPATEWPPRHCSYSPLTQVIPLYATPQPRPCRAPGCSWSVIPPWWATISVSSTPSWRLASSLSSDRIGSIWPVSIGPRTGPISFSRRRPPVTNRFPYSRGDRSLVRPWPICARTMCAPCLLLTSTISPGS